MKHIFLFITAVFYLSVSFGQETDDKRNKLTDSVTEKFTVLQTNKNIKDGLYKAFFKRKIVIATGNYKDNKKAGVWNFYKPNSQLIQTYNYDNHELILESIYDTLDDVRYRIDEKTKPIDTMTRPIRLGGIYYGFIPYLNIFQLPFDSIGVNTDEFDAFIELLISPLGRLADYKVHLVSAYYHYDHSFHLDVNLFSEEDQEFLPVTLNGKPILSRIIIRCYVTPGGHLDFY